MKALTTTGKREIQLFKNRVVRVFGLDRISRTDFEFLMSHIEAIEKKLNSLCEIIVKEEENVVA